MKLSPRARVLGALVVGGIALVTAAPGGSAAQQPKALPKDIDPLSYVLPEHQTWNDWHPIPGYDWTAPATQPAKKIRAALILADFEDQPFVVQQKGLTKNPADFYEKFLITTPGRLNHHHTINEYWLEDSFGTVGIDADTFGPYHLKGKEEEYGLTSDMNDPAKDCPTEETCDQDLDTAMIAASATDVAAGTATNGGHDYDFRWLLHSGYDESGTWEEFGPMLFPTKESVKNTVDPRTGQRLGNPQHGRPNWAKTRYDRPDGAWTSFFSAKQPWAHATPGVFSTQGESDGQSTFAHELSHIFGVLDNYGNPFAANADRDYSGPWDMLSRGTFNGPGGPHTRYTIPSASGGTMGAHHMLRTKIRLGFVLPTDVAIIPKAALKAGPLITDVVQREQPMTLAMRQAGLKYGMSILLGSDHGDTACPRPGKARCDGGGYDDYTVEVVNHVGYDSFTPDSGVLIAKTKLADTSPFLWVVDSHPDDIGVTDYVKPDGTKQMYRFGDYRQLSDALFKAGRIGHNKLQKGLANNNETTNSYGDYGNGIKFLTLTKTLRGGVLVYRVAAMSTQPTPGISYGVKVKRGAGGYGYQRFTITNTGSNTDIMRMHVLTGNTQAKLLNDLVELRAGETKTVTVSTTGNVKVTLRGVSEGDLSQRSIA